MSYTRINNLNRVFAMILAVLMIVAMVPMYVFAGDETSSVLMTDIGTKNFTVGKATEFTFTTIANGDAGEMVKGSFVFSDPDAIEKLEYRESKDGNWYVLNGDFGPETGFPMTDATSTFRVTFNKEGEFTVAVSMNTVSVDGAESVTLCSITETVKSTYVKGEVKTDIGDKVFAVNEPTEFVFETVANSDAGTLVYGMFESEYKDAISKLEYFEVKDGNWYDFALDAKFGPEGGFPMTDGTSKFRITFKEVGEYTFNAFVKNAIDDSEVCSTSVKAKVDYVASELTSNIKDVSFVVGHPIEFTYTTKANSDLGKLVFGQATFDDESVVDKLEYYEVTSGQWLEFDGKFGPESGFPMADATSKFRVTFNKVGTYNVTVQMKEATGEETILCSSEETVVVEAAYANVETLTGGEIVNNASAKVDVVVEETVLQWAPQDDSIGRYKDGWWVGINVIAPEGFSANAKYQSKNNPNADFDAPKSFVDNADSENKDQIVLGFNVSPETLTKYANEEKDLVMVYGFNWDGDADNTIEQEITVTVIPTEKIVLMQDGVQKYPYATVETLTGGDVTGNGSASVKVVVGEGTFQWLEMNSDIGRDQDGWFAGINVFAPAYFNDTAKFASKDNANDDYDFDNAQSFADYRDSEDTIGIWFPITPELFASFATKDYDPTLYYTFDWDGDGNYEQEIAFSVKRDGNIVLMKGDDQKHPDVTAPVVEVDWNGLDDDKLVKDTVVATVTITERNESFDAEKATEAVMNAIKAEAGSFEISDWDYIAPDEDPENNPDADLDDDMHKATVTFAKQGTYSFEITEYADTCGNAAVTYPEACEFVIDKTAPTGDIKAGETSILNAVWDAITFNKFDNKPIEITIKYEDDFCGIKAENVYYYIQGSTEVIDEDNIANLRLAWVQYDEANKPVIAPNAIARVYVMLVDNAGNAKYLNSRGVIAENIGGEECIKLEFPGESGKYTDAILGSEVHFYNSSADDYNINISVNEYLNVDDISSGFKKISYWFNKGDERAEDTIHTVEFTSDAAYDELVKIWNETVNIKEELGADWNRSDISFEISVEDNAGNVYGKVENIDIDVTAPQINVQINGVYTQEGFKLGHDNNFESATATVTITEREKHFNKEAATEAVKNGIVAVDGKGEAVSDAFGISEWEMITGNTPDETKFIATVTFEKNAKYTVKVTYADALGNEGVSEENAFCIDTVEPNAYINVGEKSIIRLIFDFLTFGVFDANTVTVTIDAEDELSGVNKIFYYVSDKTEHDADEKEYLVYEKGIEVSPDAIASLYVIAVDNAGNERAVNSDGIIVENDASQIEIKPQAAAGTYDNDVDADEEAEKVYYYNASSNNYNVDISVDDVVRDNGITSGIASIKHWFTVNGQTRGEVLEEFPGIGATYAELQKTWNTTVNIKEVLDEDWNSSDITICVEVTDNAGNTSSAVIYIDVDATLPTVEVEYEDTLNVHPGVEGTPVKDHFSERVATIVITERTNHFDAKVATESISILVKDGEIANYEIVKQLDSEGNEVEWLTIKGATPDEDTHTAIIKYTDDGETELDGKGANYTFDIEYTDFVKNTDADDNKAEFTVDNTKPTGSAEAEGFGLWYELLEVLTFGIWSPDTVKVTANGADSISDIYSILTYTQDLAGREKKPLKFEDLENITEWTEYSTDVNIEPDACVSVYFKITDKAGNYIYINTDGIIVDSVAPVVDDVLPVITVTPEQPINGIYSSDVKVDVKVTEPKSHEVYSGLKNIRYEIYNMGVLTQSGVLYNYNNEGNDTHDFVTEWSKNAAIIVDKKLNNSNDVEIRVYATDNAGNKHNKSEFIKIDITAPVIDITYDNNECDQSYNESAYFNADRTATIVITERNFDPADVIVTITNTDGVIPVITGFTTATADGNGDATTHTATISYTADGDYTFEIAYKDEAGLVANEINHHSVASQKFTVDKTLPVIEVTYDNNSYENGMYFAAARTATIKVTEHNFDPARFVPTTIAQGMSNWVSNGDVHTAMISFTADGDYTFDYEFADKATNKVADFTAQRYIIDTVKPEVTIIDNVKETAPEERGAYNGDINFTISYSDIYVDSNRVDLKLVDSNGKDYTFNLENGAVEGNKVTKLFVDTLENDLLPDGIYTLTVTVYDMAGNGTPIPKTFSVNRDSSNFVMDLYLGQLVNNKYNKEVEKDFIISEINCDKITGTEITIIHNGETKVLKEGEDYTVEHKGYGGDWNQYDYTVFAQNFAEDGNYSIVIKSSDEAGNTVDNLTATGEFKKTIEFSVDDTAPIIMVNGLDEDIPEIKGTAFITYEDNISVDKVIITVTVKGEKTADSHEYVIEGEELNALSDRIEHIINQANAKQEITIKVIDKAGNVSEEVVKRITINPSWWIRFVYNTPLFVGSICAVVVLIAAAIIIPIILKKKKGKKN